MIQLYTVTQLFYLFFLFFLILSIVVFSLSDKCIYGVDCINVNLMGAEKKHPRYENIFFH